MNFMSGRPGFYGDITGSAGNVSSSSPSSSSFHRGGHLLNYDYAAGGAAHLPPPDSSPTNNGGAEDSDDRMVYRRGEEGGSSRAVVIEKEHMFDKVVTPSDVGKLNRLVIPKQHAEKYFPLDSSTNEKGLLLNFEDKIGKPWRFRYSYWNSSQSYVMTKGWSRFVKEKKLDAGDTVSFQRGVGELGKDRLFIDWWHRPDAPELAPRFSIPSQISFHRSSSIHPWSPLFPQPRSRFGYSHFLHANAISPTPNQSHHHHSPTGYGPYAYNNSVLHGNPCPPASAVYLRSPRPGAAAAGGFNTQQVGMGQLAAERGRGVEQMVFNSVPVVQGKAAAKRLRLFGVNMDCPISESDECDTPSTTLPHLHQLLPPPFDDIMSSPSSSIPRPNPNRSTDDDKGKGSMSLDLDI